MLITLYRIFALAIRLSLPFSRKSLRLPERLKKMGPSFVKFGQTFSSRPDVFGEDIAQSLLVLCDNLPPFPFSQVRKIIEKDFGKNLEDIFSHFEEEAISAASVAQVHKARTFDGRIVAVKVLRPKIAKRFQRDIRLIRCSIVLLSPFLPKRLRLHEVLQLFTENIKYELDLRFEAANAAQLRANMTDDVYIPEVDWHYTSKQVLTLEWIEGRPISQIDYSPQLAKKLAVSLVRQAYYNGFFHGDMHPGNILVTHDHQLVLVDFGIVGYLDEQTKIYVAEIFLGFLKQDYKYVADVHFRAGYVKEKYERFIIACRAIGEPMLQGKISAAQLLTQLFKMTADFDIEVQPQLLLLQKTILLTEGHCLRLCPESDLWQLIKPEMERWARDNLGCKAKLSKKHLIMRAKSLMAKYENIITSLRTKPTSTDTFSRVLLLLLIIYIILNKIY